MKKDKDYILENLVEQFRLIVEESNMDLETAKSLGTILNGLIKLIKKDN